jgi:hypothetical protein
MRAAPVRGADLALGQSVIGEQHVVGAERGERGRGDVAPGADEARVVVEGFEREDLPDSRGRGLREQRRERGRGGRRRILRKQRQRDDVAHAALLEPAQRVAERGSAVSHPERHAEVRTEARFERGAQRLAVHEQRRSRLAPHLRVGRGGAARARRQDPALDEQRARQRRQVDHARVAQELAQVAAHFARPRRVGGAEVDQQRAARRSHDRSRWSSLAFGSLREACTRCHHCPSHAESATYQTG